jgi:hypothetical protein
VRGLRLRLEVAHRRQHLLVASGGLSGGGGEVEGVRERVAIGGRRQRSGSERRRSMRRRRSGVESGVDGSTSTAVERRSSRTSSAIAADHARSGAGPRADPNRLEFCSCVAAAEVELSN